MLIPSLALAHFVLQAPANMYVQDALGNPQKAPPCGDDGTAVDADAGVPTYAPGDQVMITVDETVFHPGHYRISLGETGPASLPAEPTVTAGSTPCGTASIMTPAVYPVLADDVFDHTAAFSGPQTVMVTLLLGHTCTNCRCGPAAG